MRASKTSLSYVPSDSRPGPRTKIFPQVAAGSVETSARRGGKSGDLCGARLDQIGEIVDAVDGENVAAIAGAREQASVRIEAESVDEIFVGTPQARRGAVGRNAINLGAAGSAGTGSGKGRRHHGRGRSWGDGEIAAGCRCGGVLRWRCDHDAHLRRRGSGTLLSRGSGVNIAHAVDGERGNFFLGRAVENERVAIRRDAIDQTAAIGAGNQVSLGIERKNANVDFIALEKERVLAVGADFVDLAVIAGGDIERAGCCRERCPRCTWNQDRSRVWRSRMSALRPSRPLPA